MNDKSNELQFDIGNEISRIKNADSFDLYVLKCQINKAMEASKIEEHVKENMHPDYKYVYYDNELGSEDIIINPTVFANDKVVWGIRGSDKKNISTSLFSIDLSRSSCGSDKELIDNSEEIENPWELEYRERIAVIRYINLNNQRHVKCRQIGYFSKYNHNSLRFKLLTGETVLIKSSYSLKLHQVTESEKRIFKKFENDTFHQSKLRHYLETDIYNFIQENKAKEQNALKLKNKAIRHMTLLGHELDLISEIIKSYDLDSLLQQEPLNT